MVDQVAEGILLAVVLLGFGYAIVGGALWLGAHFLGKIVGTEDDFVRAERGIATTKPETPTNPLCSDEFKKHMGMASPK